MLMVLHIHRIVFLEGLQIHISFRYSILLPLYDFLFDCRLGFSRVVHRLNQYTGRKTNLKVLAFFSVC